MAPAVLQDEVVFGSVVRHQRLLQGLDVTLISSEHAVLDHASPRGTSLPPVVRLRPYPDILLSNARSVVLVLLHQAVSILSSDRANSVFRLRVKSDRRCARRERKKWKEHSSKNVGKSHRAVKVEWSYENIEEKKR